MLRILAVLILFSFSVKAQKDYLVTSKVDTLYGEIRIQSYDQIDRVQITIDKKKQLFTALKILSLNMAGQVYKPIEYEKKIMLMKVLKEGYLSLFAFRIPNQNNYDGRLFKKMGDLPIEVPNLGFKKILGNYLDDCESVSEKVKAGDLGRKDLDQIIDSYNLCITSRNTVNYSVSAEPIIIANEVTAAIGSLINKTEAEDFPSKKDALDLLRDIQSKVEKKETTPNYLTEGLKSYLSNVPALSDDLEKLLSLLKN